MLIQTFAQLIGGVVGSQLLPVVRTKHSKRTVLGMAAAMLSFAAAFALSMHYREGHQWTEGAITMVMLTFLMFTYSG